jgi:hypothetical protein
MAPSKPKARSAALTKPPEANRKRDRQRGSRGANGFADSTDGADGAAHAAVGAAAEVGKPPEPTAKKAKPAAPTDEALPPSFDFEAFGGAALTLGHQTAFGAVEVSSSALSGLARRRHRRRQHHGRDAPNPGWR